MMKRRSRHMGKGPAMLLLGLLLGASAILEITNARCFSLVGDLACRKDMEQPVVALSFDDGPSEAGVRWVTSVLRDHGVRATFFLVGRDMERRPGLAEALLREGHELGNHSYSHSRMVFRSGSFYLQEIVRTDRLLREAGAVSPDLFRPPYGKKLVGLPKAVERSGYRMVMWDVEEPSDAADARAFADHIVGSARPGSIILMHVMHPSRQMAREALPLVIDGLKRRGFRIVPVGALLAGAAPKA